MANNFLHNEDEINSIITSFNNNLNSYKTDIASLEKLISGIKSSNSWQDQSLKSSFAATAEGYLTAYKTFCDGIEGYIECLSKKNNNLIEHETNFTK